MSPVEVSPPNHIVDMEAKRHTAGLNKPPLMRKNIHTLTSREKPNERAI